MNSKNAMVVAKFLIDGLKKIYICLSVTEL